MVTEGTLPRDALRQVEQRLTAAGCPDADFDAAELLRLVLGVDVRLAFAPLTAEQAARLEELTARRAGLSSTLNWPSAPVCSARGRTPRWWPKRQPGC